MRRLRILGVALTIMLSFAALTLPVAAGIKDNPPPLTGWTHSPYPPNDSNQGHGRLLSGDQIDFGSPTIAEVDGNTSNGKEMVIGGRDGRVYVLSKTGATLWQRDVPGAGCEAPFIYSKPTVGALFGGSTNYVVVGYGTRNLNPNCEGGVVVYRGSDGATTWNFSLKAYDDQTVEGPEAGYGVLSSVALADVDKDGQMELAFGGLDRNLYLLNANGTVRWYYHAADTVWSTPLFMNVDGDAQLELVAGTDITANPGIIPPTTAGGFMHAFETAARSDPRIPFQTGFIWRVPFEQVIYSSPIAADLLPSNSGLEIAVGSGCFYPEGNPVKSGAWVKILRPSDGAVLQTLNATGCTQSSPAAADIDEDGAKEVVILARGEGNGGDGKTRVIAWDPTNPAPKWTAVPYNPNSAPNDPAGHDALNDMQSPVIADLDGNGSLEVLVTNFWSVHVLAGKTGSFLTCQNTSCGSQVSLFAWGTLKGTPAVGDIDNDGELEVFIGGMHIFNPNRAHVYAWTDFDGVLNSASGTLSAYSAPWPEFRRTATADGVLSEPGLTASVKDLRALSAGDVRTYKIALGSLDGSSISPSASVINDANGIASVSVVGRILTVTLDPGGLGVGNYTATVRVTSPGVPAITISLSLGVANSVDTIQLPMTTS